MHRVAPLFNMSVKFLKLLIDPVQALAYLVFVHVVAGNGKSALDCVRALRTVQADTGNQPSVSALTIAAHLMCGDVQV